MKKEALSEYPEELLEYSWEDLAGALLAKSQKHDCEREKGHTIQNIIDKARDYSDFVREHADFPKKTGVPMWALVHEKSAALTQAIHGFACNAQHSDNQYRYMFVENVVEEAKMVVSMYTKPVWDFADRHSDIYGEHKVASVLLKKILADYENMLTEGQ